MLGKEWVTAKFLGGYTTIWRLHKSLNQSRQRCLGFGGYTSLWVGVDNAVWDSEATRYTTLWRLHNSGVYKDKEATRHLEYFRIPQDLKWQDNQRTHQLTLPSLKLDSNLPFAPPNIWNITELVLDACTVLYIVVANIILWFWLLSIRTCSYMCDASKKTIYMVVNLYLVIEVRHANRIFYSKALYLLIALGMGAEPIFQYYHHTYLYRIFPIYFQIQFELWT